MDIPTTTGHASHEVVAHDEWIAARKQLIQREKELTHLRDRVAEARRALPWLRIDKPYVFDTIDGPRALADLFDGRSQLLVQHFMFGPDWAQGCPSCSFMADHMGGMQPHLEHRDVSVLAVSRAPLEQIERFRQRMGWTFRWVSSLHNDFNFDFDVSFTPEQQARGEVTYNFERGPARGDEAPGISAFYRNDAGEVFRTYSTYGRGVEAMMGTYDLLDLMPKGRDEREVPYKMEWVRHHDLYAPRTKSASSPAGGCCHPDP